MEESLEQKTFGGKLRKFVRNHKSKLVTSACVLGGILGMLEGLSIRNKGQYIMYNAEQKMPVRYKEVKNELFELTHSNNVSMIQLAKDPKAAEFLQRYKELLAENKTYLESPDIKNLNLDYNYGSLNNSMGYVMAGVGLVFASIAGLVGCCCGEESKSKN